jgi:hypothetical protein
MEQILFLVEDSAGYAVRAGAESATPWTIRRLIGSGELGARRILREPLAEGQVGDNCKKECFRRRTI